MRVALDYSPAVAQAAGVGRYARELAKELASRLGRDLVLWYGRVPRTHAIPPAGATTRPLPFSPKDLTRLWHRLRVPFPVEIATGPVDVVHGTDFLAPPARASRVVTIHDLSFLLVPELGHPRLVRFLAEAVPRTLQSTGHVVAVSEAVRAELLRLLRLDPERVHAIPHGVSPRFQPIRTERRTPLLASLGVRDPYVIAVGTIEPRKGYPILLRAVERLAPTLPDLQLVIVGASGWLAEPIEAEITRAVQRGRVLWLQGVDDALLAALYSGARAFVSASYYEGFNLPLLEALACGAPAVVTDLPVHREVAANAALYVRAASPEELAEALRSILLQEIDVERLQRAALARASRFTWSESAERHLDVYRVAAADHPPRARRPDRP
ncbi:MAG: glycosyltransferase family 4 protein [Thermomicrobium sp.]|nr:glycosyltransferase family 4 protein [Thermomicrobium sp.]